MRSQASYRAAQVQPCRRPRSPTLSEAVALLCCCSVSLFFGSKNSKNNNTSNNNNNNNNSNNDNDNDKYLRFAAHDELGRCRTSLASPEQFFGCVQSVILLLMFLSRVFTVLLHLCDLVDWLKVSPTLLVPPSAHPLRRAMHAGAQRLCVAAAEIVKL